MLSSDILKRNGYLPPLQTTKHSMGWYSCPNRHLHNKGETMVDSAIFKTYLSQIEQACKARNATEHTHRPALKNLIEAFQPGVIATNEPKRIKCGAPDYIITRDDVPMGFIQAKNTP